MVPPTLLRDPEVRSEQASWRIRHGRVNFGAARGAMARYESRPFGSLQAGLPGVFLDLGGRLRTTHLCRRTTTRGDLVVPDPNWRCVLFPAFSGGAAARRQVRAPAAAPV